jgi:hypothetical protein
MDQRGELDVPEALRQADGVAEDDETNGQDGLESAADLKGRNNHHDGYVEYEDAFHLLDCVFDDVLGSWYRFGSSVVV